MMAKAATLCLVFIVSNFFSIPYVSGDSNGLTIKLIHRDSLESPFYQPNLTFAEQIERLVNQSKTRMQHLSNLPNNLRIKVDVERYFIFSAQIGIGTFQNNKESFKKYNFVLDVGSSLTWLECQDCKLPGNHCLREVGEPFPDHTSTTYRRLSCNSTRGPLHPICNPKECIEDFCAYHTRYMDNSTSTGYLAHETFTFETTTHRGSKERVYLVFGCAFDTRDHILTNSSIVAGILGLGWGPKSFVTQLGSKSNGIFSYCLQRMNQRSLTSYLQFGDSIPTARAIHKTRLHSYPADFSYYVNLIGITAAGKRLNILANVFARNHNNGTGGCMMDSGSGVTHIVNAAYIKLKERLTEYFESVHGFTRTTMPIYNFCYQRTTMQGFRNLPTIIFHFERADLKLEPQSIFHVVEGSSKEIICMLILPNNGPDRLTIIGAYQQTNHRFIYNTHEHMLHFGPENCSI